MFRNQDFRYNLLLTLVQEQERSVHEQTKLALFKCEYEQSKAFNILKEIFSKKKKNFDEKNLQGYGNSIKDTISAIGIFQNKEKQQLVYKKIFKLYKELPSLIKNFEEDLKENSEKKLVNRYKNMIYLQLSAGLFKEAELDSIL